MVSKVSVGMSTPDMYIHTNAKFIVICKPRTLNDEGEDAALASVTKINITDRSLIQLRL